MPIRPSFLEKQNLKPQKIGKLTDKEHVWMLSDFFV